MKRLLMLLALALSVAGCRDAAHDDHKHDDGEGHGHGHGHGGGESVTLWGERGEIFGEYAPFVAGADSETAIHVTYMATFKPMLKGSLTIELTQSNGEKVSVTADAPARAGIFTPKIKPMTRGKCTLAFIVKDAKWSERFETKNCEVHAKRPKEEEEEEDDGIGFTKEQQWTVDFATAAVVEREIRASVRVTAQIKPAVGRHAHLTAPLRGRVRFAKQAPIIGTHVVKGQLLATVTPPITGATNRTTLQAGFAAAMAELKAAKADKLRVDRLAKGDAIATRRVREATTRAAIARSRVQAAGARLREYNASVGGRGGANAFRLRSPIDGLLVKVEVTSGETVAAGSHMFSVIDVGTVWVEGRVFESDIQKITGAREATFRVEGFAKPFTIDEKTGRLVTVGHLLDPQSRTVPIVFEVKNPRKALRIGQFATLDVAVGSRSKQLTIPEGAVTTDGGRSVVFVQTSGESFAKRLVKTGVRAGGLVAIESGLKKSEHVVVRGAHLVKLAGAAASGAVGHGHAH